MAIVVSALATSAALAIGCSDDAPPVMSEQQEAATERSASTASSATSETSDQGQASNESNESATTQQAQTDSQEMASVASSSLAEAEAAYLAWSEQLETMVMDIRLDLSLGVLSTELPGSISMQVEPLVMLVSLDASGVTGILMPTNGEDESADSLLMHVLISEDAAYMSMPELGGWIDLSADLETALSGLSATLGADPTSLVDADQLAQAIQCAATVGGDVTVAQVDGEDVWVIDCRIDAEAMNEASADLLAEFGIDPVEAGIESLSLSMIVSQETGAPLRMESVQTLDDSLRFGMAGDGAEDGDEGEESGFSVTTVMTLRSFNEPVEFPSPEPLIDGSLLGLGGDSQSAEGAGSPGSDESSGADFDELPSADALYDLAEAWAMSQDELHMELVVDALIDGDMRTSTSEVLSSRTQGKFETVVHVDENGPFRLLWTRDGIWTSDADVAGQPSWVASSPALLGFDGASVDDFLANPDRLNLEPLRPLVGQAWVSREIKGDEPPLFEVGIEWGFVESDSQHFDRLADVLKGVLAELLAESIVIESIDYYSTTLTMVGDAGEVSGQVTTAEIVSNAGPVQFDAQLRMLPGRPVSFSPAPE